MVKVDVRSRTATQGRMASFLQATDAMGFAIVIPKGNGLVTRASAARVRDSSGLANELGY